MNNFFDNQRILNLIWKRKFHFILVGIIAIILSAIFSGPTFITPKFKSTARIYPTSNVAVFSEESRTEQMLEVLNSRDIKIKMFDAFRLDTVYKVDKDSPKYLTYMMDIYNSNVSASKTKFETVEIVVLDENPIRAAQMCDSIIHFYNLKVREMHAVKYLEIVKLTDDRLKQKYVELDSLQPKFDKFRNNYDIFDYKTQAEEVTKAYMKSVAKKQTDQSGLNFLKKQYEDLKDHGTEAYIVERLYWNARVSIDSMIETKVIALAEANKKITYSHIVEYPLPADKKSYPVRWLIVAFSAFSAVFLALLVFLVIDYRKSV